jgi:F-type H+-transporting ATPase subunit delta
VREFVLGFGIGTSEIASRRSLSETLTSDWNALLEVFSANSELRQVFLDVATPVATRVLLARDLFANKVSDLPLELLLVVVEEESPRFVIETLHELRRVLLGEYVLGAPGFVGARRRVDGYAYAYFRVDGRSDLEVYERDLYAAASLIGRSRELRRTLSGFGSDEDLRAGVVDDLFGSRVEEPVLKVISFAARATKARDIVDVLDRLAGFAARERGRRIAQVRSARALSPESRLRVLASLSEAVGRDLELRCEVDPSLLGGVVVVIGDTVYDGTVRHRLDVARLALAKVAD